MPKIYTSKELFRILGQLLLYLLATFGFANLGMVQVILPTFADTIYSIIGQGIQIVIYLFIIVLVIIGGLLIVSYFKNRRKPRESSEEIKVIGELSNTITELIKDAFQKLK